MTRLVLLEHVPAAFRPEPGDTVVAMTPEACYELDRRGTPYKLTTDFGIEARLAGLEAAHWQEQLEWLESFDELLAAKVPETGRWRFGAATLYGYNLKTLLDPVRIRALELDSMLESHDRVLLHRRAEADPPISWRLVFQGPSVTSRVLPLVAGARGIPFEERVDDETPALAIPAPVRDEEQVGFVERLGGAVSRVVRRLPARPRASRLTLLFADFGYDLTALLTRARAHGHRCLRVVGDSVVEEGRGRMEIVGLPTEGPDTGWASAAEAVDASDHPLWAWPNGWLPGVPLADVLRPRVRYWLESLMPRVAARAAALQSVIEGEGVDFVLGANVVQPDVVPAAAVSARPTQSVFVDHGHDALAQELFDLIMLRYVDHDFSPTSEFAGYLESRRGLYDFPAAEVHVGSYQWRENASLSRSGRPPQPAPTPGRPIVVYALTATAGDARYLNSAFFADGWYYRLCREIVDVLARHPEVFSVVKLFPGDGNLRHPIDLYVDDLGLDHVVSSRASLRAWIPWADRIVFDLPSTGLYEAATAGVPYLALLYAGHPHRPAAVEALGAAAVRFTEPEDAARAVDAFVSSPTVTAPRLHPEGEEILTSLERVARR